MTKKMSKRQERKEKKKKKLAALVEITKLNDKDREIKTLAQSQDDQSNERESNNEELKRKRHSLRSTNVPMSDEKEENLATDSSESLVTKKPRLVGDEYHQLKEELKLRKKKLTARPRLRLKVAGENASLTLKDDDRTPIFLRDIQHLLLYSLLGHYCPYVPDRWCSLEKYNKITHTIVLVIEGLSVDHFSMHKSIFPDVTNNLEYQLELITPAAYGGTLTEELVAVPLTGMQKNKLINKFGSVDMAIKYSQDIIKVLTSVFSTDQLISDNNSTIENESIDLPTSDKFPRTHLLLSLWQMIEENYPVPLKSELGRKYGDYILTKDSYKEATAKSPMFGLDCEMCRTTTGSLELTRISIVDENFDTVYDTLVKPENKITDYLTRYSGITKEILKDVTTTLSDVQQKLRSLLPADAILVGQSLNSDLHTLKMMHPYIIDTSVIFNITGDRYRKTKLQTLAREFLGKQIQDKKSGHCSTEDSIACLRLTKLKLAHSVDYGDAVLAGVCGIEGLNISTEVGKSQIFIEKSKLNTYATSIFNHLAKNGKISTIVGKPDFVNDYSKYLSNSTLNVMDHAHFSKGDQVSLLVTENDTDTITQASQIAMEYAFTICGMKIAKEQLVNENIEKTMTNVNEWIQKLWHGIALNGFFCVIFSGETKATNGSCFLGIKKELV